MQTGNYNRSNYNYVAGQVGKILVYDVEKMQKYLIGHGWSDSTKDNLFDTAWFNDSISIIVDGMLSAFMFQCHLNHCTDPQDFMLFLINPDHDS